MEDLLHALSLSKTLSSLSGECINTHRAWRGPMTNIERVAQLERKARALGKVQQPTALAPQAPERLPVWAVSARAVPNGMLRSALFGSIGRGRRQYLKEEKIAALHGIDICYTGERLDQGDLDVWLSILHCNRFEVLGTQPHTSAYAILKIMGITDTGRNRSILYDRIKRLRAGTISLRQGDQIYIGGLINEAFKDSNTGKWVIMLNPKLQSLFAADQFTLIDWAIRNALRGKPLAQWLHGFYASHARPLPMRMDFLLELAGSEGINPGSARQTLRRALRVVTETSKAYGENINFTIHEGLVHTNKTATGAQRRHLARKAATVKKQGR